MTTLTTGQVAKAADVNVETLRFYERKGLIEEPARLESGHRRYPPEAVTRIQFIKRAQELGFSLQEVQELIDLRVAPGTTAADVRRRVVAKSEEIDRKIQHLRSLKKALSRLADSCSGCGPVSSCSILDNLDRRTLKP